MTDMPDHKDKQTVYRGLLRLAEKGDKLAIQGVLDLLQDESADTALSTRAIKAVGRIDDDRAVESLWAALHDEHTSVRYAAAMALGKTDDKQIVGTLWIVLHET